MKCVTSLQKSPPVSKRAATSLVLSKLLPAFSLLYPYKVVFRFQPEYILLELAKLNRFEIDWVIGGRYQFMGTGKYICVIWGGKKGSPQKNQFIL